MRKINVPVGTKFGEWTTVSEKYKRSNSHHYVVDVVCSCGKQTTVYAAQLTGGRTARCWTCGNGSKPRVSASDYVVNVVFGHYKKSAQKIELDFSLTKEDFSKLIFEKCHYCGREPINMVKDRYTQRELPAYSGLDRVDNSIGYSIKNVVPSCRWCNEAKKAKTSEQWESWIKGLVENYYLRNGAS